MPESILVHAAYPLWRKNTLVTLARARQLRSQGHDVSLTYCASRSGTCAVNYMGNPVTCAICRYGIRATAGKLGLPTIPLEADSVPAAGLSLSEKKELLEGVYSGLVSTFRFLPKDIDRITFLKAIKRRYFQTSTRLLAALKQLFAKRLPDRIEVFNGRHACSKFCLLAARELGVPFNTLEVTSQTQPIVFEGHTAHDRERIQERILRNEADFEVAEAYFKSRRLPRVNKFARRHARRFSPPAVKDCVRRVSFFLSSQDEFEALGRNWKSPFADYARVIEEACRRHPDYFYCVRFHPNQADIGSDIVSPFREMAKHENVQVYYPRDAADTYALIEWSDLVVTFGSTVSVEACWMGKPVILLGPSFYDRLEVAYTPLSVDAFLELLAKELRPKSKKNAARLARYIQQDCDPLEDLCCRPGNMVPRGFGRSASVLTYFARYLEVASCHAVKAVGQARLKRA